MRIVFSTWGSLGDLHPYLALAVELKRRGHQTAVATLPSWRDHVVGAGVGFHPAGPDVPADDAKARELVRRVLDAREGPPYLFRQVLGPKMRESFEELLAAIRADGGADLLISHQIPVTAPIVAEVTGINWISCVLLPMSFLSAFDPPTPPQAPALRAIAAIHPLVGGIFNRLGRLVSRSWVEPVYRFRESIGLARGANPVFEGQHSPRLVLALFSRALASTQPDYPPQAIVTGFPFYDGADRHPASDELMRFLDDGEPPILFTLGSSAVWIAGDFYQASIDAATRLGRRALLLAGENTATLLRQGLPKTIGVFDYAPHSVVMPRASAIVHQGGVGTTGQAMRSGRPMLVVPFGQDQPDNARRCVQLGIARTMSRHKYAGPAVAGHLRALLEDPSYAAHAAEVAGIVRSERGTETACDAIEAAWASGPAAVRGG